MQRRAVLHIGPMKTGTSSIQTWLARGSADLKRQGYFVPRAMTSNMSRLAQIAQARVLDLEPTALDTTRLDALTAELNELGPDMHTILISAEMLGHQLRKPEQLQFVKDLLGPYVTEYSVHPYLRRQDELSLSLYSTALRRGERRTRLLANPFDFEQMLDLWAGVFGASNVHPRVYEKASLIGGDVVQDFAATASIPFHGTNQQALQENPSLKPEAQAFLATFAAKVRETGFDRPFEAVAGHALINHLLSSRYAGPGLLPSRDEVIAFYAKVAASNERVRQRWFPDRPTLFSEDFSRYPETPAPPVSPAAILDVALEVLSDLVTAQAKADPPTKTDGDLERRALAERLRKERRGKRVGERRLRPGNRAAGDER